MFIDSGFSAVSEVRRNNLKTSIESSQVKIMLGYKLDTVLIIS